MDETGIEVFWINYMYKFDVNEKYIAYGIRTCVFVRVQFYNLKKKK